MSRAAAPRFTTRWLPLSDHLKKSGALEKKVLLVVTDGEDNASRESLEQAIRRLEEKNGPTVYTIGLLGEEHSKRARRALREMAEDTGGVAFFPKDLSEVQAITSQIAHDIRNQYTIQYKPGTPQSAGGYRTVKVEAQAQALTRSCRSARGAAITPASKALPPPRQPTQNSLERQPIRQFPIQAHCRSFSQQSVPAR